MRLTPERLVAGGEALARDGDGRVVFVPGALPGEVVDVTVDDVKKDFARARLVEVVDPSPQRRTPPCPHRRAGCGGCDWMHLEREAQLAAKVEVVRDALRRTARLGRDLVDALVRPGGAVDPFAYRTTLRVVGTGDGVGFRERRSDQVVPVDSCPVADERLSRLVSRLAADVGQEVTLRVSTATGAITAHWDGRRAVRGLPPGVYTGDRAWLIERVGGVDLRVSAASFFQSGVQAAELLVTAVAAAAPELPNAAHAVDAYGGIGLFAATAMREAGHVTLVESSVPACRDARRNLAARSATVERGEVARWRADPGRGPVDVVVADPARSGLGRPGVAALTVAAPAVLVLVSCDPVSLARDAALLHEAGFAAASVEVFDLFPQTHHVETVTRFVRP